MKITNFETKIINLASSTGRREYVILIIETDEGIYGLGEGTSKGQARAVSSCIDFLSNYFIGQDPFNSERIFQDMYRNEWYSDNVINMTSIAAIDTAIWDIKGKALDKPLYELLGGSMSEKNRVKVYVYGMLPSTDDMDVLRDSAQELVEQGVKGVKFSPFGKVWQRLNQEEFESGLSEIRAVREALGSDIELFIDGRCRFSPATAIQISRSLDEFFLGFFEEPTQPDNLSALRKVSERSPIPIAAGEHAHSKFAHQELLDQTDVDIVQPDLVNAGGPTEAKKIAAMAEANHVGFAPHNSNGVIGTIMTLHVDLSTPNFVIQEAIPHTWETGWNEIVDNPLELEDGYLFVPDRPGLGVEVDMDLLDQFSPTEGNAKEPTTDRWDLYHP